MNVGLPVFRYHPDPVATGSVAQSAEVCGRCGAARGFVYVGPTYAVEEVEFLCPWCIADGSASKHFDAVFTTTDGAPGDVPADVLDDVARRTPGFAGWQQERWMFHCADAAEFHGRAGWEQVRATPGAVDSLLVEGWREDVLPHLSADGDLTAYLFRCRHCGQGLAYADST
ncbi:CbrC family protein [Kribbella sp. NPDC050820]|uniref:CbrC family protein n=1 Tax=Kribbella sp. NPDC050820 TaxID=3155408 RepID=UPI0033E27CBF